MHNRNSSGTLVWITGLPGAGKTVFAEKLSEDIRQFSPATVHIDGDIVREIMGNDLGYSTAERKKNAYRIARLCAYLANQGMIVVCSTVSMYHDVREWNKCHVHNLIEVYIEVSQDVLRARDKKMLYSQRYLRDEVVGVNQEYDIPQNPSFVIVNDNDLDSFLKHTESVFAGIYTKKK
ncbi:MAG: adenylyl-sulfate kinase [Patescibacteria group bacterium]